MIDFLAWASDPTFPERRLQANYVMGYQAFATGAAMNITANEKAFAHRCLTGYEDDSVRQLSAGLLRGVVRLKLVKKGIT